MSLSIWKFQLNVRVNQKIFLPKDAKILSVQNQNEFPCIWAIVDVNNEKEEREFEIIDTGKQEIPFGKNLIFIGTFQLNYGTYVGHLFEIVEL